MRFITILLTFGFLLVWGLGFSQKPVFASALNTSPSVVCYDGQLTATATASNANFYQFEKKNIASDTWENIDGASGDPSSTSGIINYTFYNIRESITFRLMVSNANGPIYSSEITVNPQRPVFNFHPIDITQCNGLTAVFKTSASGSGTLSYQWQQSTDGGNHFINLSSTTKYTGVNTSQLSVRNLINSNHNYQYKCIITDQNGCENYSNSGTLFVNQLSTSPSPTTTTKYCEGDAANFTLERVVGSTNSYQWQIRRTGEAGYGNIFESAHYQGVSTNHLKVNGILPNETAYRVFVNYNTISQSDGGNEIFGTCNLNSSRAGYTIRPRPQAPKQIEDLEICGEGKISTSITDLGNYYWYTDTLLAPFVANAPNFTSPIISQNTKFFYSLKDANACESYRKEFSGIVRAIPSQVFGSNFSICPSENSLEIVFSNVQNDPLQIYVLNGTEALPNFTEITKAIYASNYDINLPNIKNPDTYNFLIFTKNAYCYSDTSEISLYVKKPTQIIENPSGGTFCEGTNIDLNTIWDAETPVTFQWLKNNAVLPDSTTETLRFENSVLSYAGEYKLQVRGQCGVETSSAAVLNILAKTVINTQPIETEGCKNGQITFSIGASGSGTVHYQWYKNGSMIGSDQNTLQLENIQPIDDNAEIKCSVSSDCGPTVFSETVKVIVNPLPAEPIIASEIGFCKSQTPAVLTTQANGSNLLKWFDATKTLLPTNQIDISQTTQRDFYVSQIDNKGCESSLKPFSVVISEPFSLRVTPNINALCSSGNFNRESLIESIITPAGFLPESYALFESNTLQQSNTTGEFSISKGGFYKVIAKNGYCEDSAKVIIENLFPELNTKPEVIDREVCKGNDTFLEATGSYTGGKYIWWEGENSPFQLLEGAQFRATNIQYPQKFFVSYSKKSNDIFCETDRIEGNITLKNSLEIEAQSTTVSCLGLPDGSLKITALTGSSPFTYILNASNENQTGIFENLRAETYHIQIIDAEGCSGDSSIVIETPATTTISSQPQNTARCRGNQANFSVLASNYEQIVWERKLPGDSVFSQISGATALTLTLTNIGNTTNPHLSVFRAKFTKGSCIIFSKEATLFVNAITGTGSPISTCEGQAETIDISDYAIVGDVDLYQWQYRVGTSGSFVDIAGKVNSSLTLSNIQKSDEGFYRCKLTFDNGGGNTCVINTSSSGVKLNVDLPQKPLLSGEKSICKGASTILSASNCTGVITWSTGDTGLSLIVSPDKTTTYTANCQLGQCNTPADKGVEITVLESQSNAPTISSQRLTYCFGETITLSATNCIGEILWSNNQTGIETTIKAQENLSISAICQTSECQSPQSQTLFIKVNPVLTAGSIAENTATNCAGFNPLTIASIQNPSGGTIQWQKAVDCSAANPFWENVI